MWETIRMYAASSGYLALWVFGASALTIAGLLHFREKLPSMIDRLVAWFFVCAFFVALRPLGVIESLIGVAVMLVFVPFLSSSRIIPILALSLALGVGAGIYSGYQGMRARLAARAETRAAEPAPLLGETGGFDPNVFFHSGAVSPALRFRLLDVDAGGAPLHIPVPQGYDYQPDPARPADAPGLVASGVMSRDGLYPMLKFRVSVREVPPPFDAPARLSFVREQYRRLDSVDAVRLAIAAGALDVREEIHRLRTVEMNTPQAVAVYQRTDIANSRHATSNLQASARLATAGGRVLDIEVETSYPGKDDPQPIDKTFIMSWLARMVEMNGG